MTHDQQRRDDVRIQEVHAEVHVAEGVGTLQPEDVKRIVEIVMQRIADERDRCAQRESDVGIRNRVFDYGV